MEQSQLPDPMDVPETLQQLEPTDLGFQETWLKANKLETSCHNRSNPKSMVSSPCLYGKKRFHQLLSGDSSLSFLMMSAQMRETFRLRNLILNQWKRNQRSQNLRNLVHHLWHLWAILMLASWIPLGRCLGYFKLTFWTWPAKHKLSSGNQRCELIPGGVQTT